MKKKSYILSHIPQKIQIKVKKPQTSKEQSIKQKIQMEFKYERFGSESKSGEQYKLLESEIEFSENEVYNKIKQCSLLYSFFFF